MQEPVSYDQIKGMVGSLLFLWSALERDLREIVAARHEGTLPRSAHKLSALIRHWADDLSGLDGADPLRAGLVATVARELGDHLALRNAICHGLLGGRGESHEGPAVLSCDLNGVRHEKTSDEIQATCTRLARLPRAIALLSRPGDLPDAAWWREELRLEPARQARVAQG